MKIAVIVCIWVIALTLLYLLGQKYATLRRSRDRLLEAAEADLPSSRAANDDSVGFLPRWLFRAGFRSAAAPGIFLAWMAGALSLGTLIACAVHASGLLRQAAGTVGLVPGGVGDILVPMVYFTPWFLLLALGSFPVVLVRAARRKRMAQVEQDLPITLELLATLSEAGIGFDAALDRILASQPADRLLAQEFRIFQLEILAGRPRIQCLRRFSWRVDVTSLTIFVSALVQTEQVGAGVADVLRRQADDLRGRRREQALSVAAALPVKLLFPLVICFLPGIMVATLGPTFYQIFQFMDGLTRTGGIRLP